MMGRRIQMRQLTQIIALIALGVFWGASHEASAAEQRCNELGANCECSEPLNTNSYTEVSSAYWAANDTTTKKCNLEGIAGAIISNGSGFNFQAVSSGEALTRLPAAHTNTWVLKTLDGGGGQFNGHQFAATNTAHIAMRWYHYYSSNHAFNNDGGGCLNSGKFLQFGAGAPIGQHNGSPHLYGWGTTWAPGGIDCCIYGPGPSTFRDEGNAKLKGKWWRFEAHVFNTLPTGSVTKIKVYRKNVTDNTPEELFIDTTQVTSQPVSDNWSSTLATTIKPTSRISNIWTDWFRNGTCSGFQAVSHYLAASWDTDAGQRIGAAVEIEGGGDTTPPIPPTGLRISMLMEEGQ